MSNFETLIKNLDNDDIQTRIETIEALGQLGDKRAISALSKLIKDPNEKIRDCAIWTLGLLNASEVLIKNLNHELDSVRIYIIEVLGKMEEKTALIPLIKLLEDPNEEIRASSAWALGKIADKKAFEPLIKCLSDKSDEVRENTSWALGKFNDNRAIPHLINAFSDPNEVVKMNAKESIEKIYKYLEESHLIKEKSGLVYKCPAKNEFCKQEKKIIEKYSDNYVTLEIQMNKNCKLALICEVKLI